MDLVPPTRVRAHKACCRHTRANAILFIDGVIRSFTFCWLAISAHTSRGGQYHGVLRGDLNEDRLR